MKNATTLGRLFDPRNNNLNFVRLFLAIAVVVSHSYLIAWGSQSAEPLIRWSNGQLDLGSLAVDCFFMISGFLLVMSWQNSRTWLNFLERRALRIYPGFAACVAVCILLIGPLALDGADLHHYFQNSRTYGLLPYLFLLSFGDHLPGVFEQNPLPILVNLSLWTIRYEILCYLTLAMLGVLKMLTPRIVLGLLTALYLFYNVTSWPKSSFLMEDRFGVTFFFIMGRLLTYFLTGSVFYLYRDKIPFNKHLLLVSLLLIALSVPYNMHILLPLCGGYCLFYACFTPRLPLAQFGRQWDLSYGTYLYGFPIEQLLVRYFPGLRQPLLLSLVAVPCVLLVAAGSWAFVERPFLKLKARKLKPQDALQAA